MAQLDKPIIHFQIPLLPPKDGECREDRFAISFEGVSFFKRWVENQIGDKAYIITTPFDIDIIGAEVEKVKVDEITLKEFLEKYDFKDGKK